MTPLELKTAIIETAAALAVPTAVAIQLAETVALQLPGKPKMTRQEVRAAVVRDWRRGVSVPELMRRYECSKTTVYRYLGQD